MIRRRYGGFATLEESHSHTPIREICSEGVIPLDDLRDFWWVSSELPDGKNIPEKLNPLSRVHARHRRQTDDRRTDMPCHSKRNVVTFG